MFDAERFIKVFEQFWSEPDLELLPEILHPEIRLIQPLLPPIHGIEAAKQSFEELFGWLPDLRAQVTRWAATEDAVLVEFTMSATIGGRRLEWPTVDRFSIVDGLAIERVAHFDPLPLLGRTLRSPTAAWGFVRSVGLPTLGKRRRSEP